MSPAYFRELQNDVNEMALLIATLRAEVADLKHELAAKDLEIRTLRNSTHEPN